MNLTDCCYGCLCEPAYSLKDVILGQMAPLAIIFIAVVAVSVVEVWYHNHKKHKRGKK